MADAIKLVNLGTSPELAKEIAKQIGAAETAVANKPEVQALTREAEQAFAEAEADGRFAALGVQKGLLVVAPRGSGGSGAAPFRVAISAAEAELPLISTANGTPTRMEKPKPISTSLSVTPPLTIRRGQ